MLTILIVDDSLTSRLLFRAHLPKDARCELHEASDLEGTLRQADAQHPDVIVLDYNMPGANGFEIARALIARGVPARRVLLTANTQQAVLEEARALDFFCVVEKPITTPKLASLLAEVAYEA